MTDTERKRIFSRNLLDVLNKTRKTQIQVATAIGVSQQTFNTWCRGIALPRMGKIQLLADYFNIDMADLIEEKPTTLTPPPAAGSTLSKDREELLCKYDSLNDEGKAKVLDYTSDLVAGGRYEKVSDEQNTVSGTGA